MSLTLPAFNMLGAVILLCAFLQISPLRFRTMLKLNQIEALALGAAALWQGFVQHAWPLYGMVVLIWAFQALALPHVLRRMMVLLKTPMETGKMLQPACSMLVGLLPVVLSALAVLQVTKAPLPPTSENMAMAFGILLLGLWLMVVHSQPLAQIIGFMTLENGVILGLINASELGWTVDVAVAALLSMEICLIFLVYWRYGMPEKTKTDGADL